MALTESKIKDLVDKKFDDLYTNDEKKWVALAKTAYKHAKENITAGKEPRPDDVAKALYPMLEVDEALRTHQEEYKARATAYLTEIKRAYSKSPLAELATKELISLGAAEAPKDPKAPNK